MAAPNHVIRRRANLVSANSESYREKCRLLILTILRELVHNPETVDVICECGEKTVVFRVSCVAESYGQILGSRGKNINGLRALITAMMARKGLRAVIELPYFPPS